MQKARLNGVVGDARDPAPVTNREYGRRWNARVAGILAAVRIEARTLLVLGLATYLLAGALIVWVFGNSPIATLLVMGYFQLMVIYMATDRIYRCIRGGFEVGIASQEETMPVFERLSESSEKLGDVASELDRSLKGGILDRLEGHLKAIRERVDRDTTPLPHPRRRPVEIDGAPVGTDAHDDTQG